MIVELLHCLVVHGVKVALNFFELNYIIQSRAHLTGYGLESI